jgi:hypothetical protein
MRPLVAHCHLGLGKLYQRTGQREQAQEHLTTATTMYREMGMTYWLARAEGPNYISLTLRLKRIGQPDVFQRRLTLSWR